MAAPEVLEIDGSYLEGGGQILRNALSLSCILRRPIRITNIRANRPNPGLSNQHLYGLNLLVNICKARVTGNQLKSTVVEFHPGPINAGSYTVDTRTAASVSLVLQAALPVLLFAGGQSHVRLIGGTNVGMAPQVDFMTEVFRPNLEMFGATFDFTLTRRGYYPRGGGFCEVDIEPVPLLKAVDLTDFGQVESIAGWCFVAGKLPEHLAHEMRAAAERELHKYAQLMQLEAYKEDGEQARDNGSGLVLTAATSSGRVIGVDVLGERKVDAQEMGSRAGQLLSTYLESKTCVDSHVQDQLILFMSLADGESRMQTGPLTNHTRTALHVAKLMTGAEFTVEESTAGSGQTIVKCKGIGLRNTNNLS